MSKETKEEKAIRYLTTGRVVVQYHDPRVLTEVHVTGDTGGEPYIAVYRGGVWSCDCPAQVVCAHILACKAIIPVSGVVVAEETGIGLDAILDG